MLDKPITAVFLCELKYAITLCVLNMCFFDVISVNHNKKEKQNLKDNEYSQSYNGGFVNVYKRSTIGDIQAKKLHVK